MRVNGWVWLGGQVSETKYEEVNSSQSERMWGVSELECLGELASHEMD